MFANRYIGGVKVPCVVFYLLAVLAIVLYGYYIRSTKTKDRLAEQFYDHPVCQEVDGWSVSHLVFFGVLGFLYPGHHLQFFLVGVFWEIIESALGQNRVELSGRRLQLVGDQDREGNPVDTFWYGKESDIVMDTLGYTVGSAVAARYWPNLYDSR